MAGQVFNYSLKFNADSAAATQAINQLQASLLEIQKNPLKLAVDQSSFTEAAKAAQELSMHLSRATDANTGKLNVNQLSASLKKAGTDLTQLSTKLLEIGPTGTQAFTQLSSAIASSNTPLKQMNSTLKSLGTSLANTAKWQLSSSLVHGFVGGLQSALNYAKDLNKSLTDIRIVTGYSTEQMAKFAEQANKAAKNLATTTTGYTNAALIYYQQGDSDAEVAKKAEITLKAANAAFGASAKEMSEYLTAVWNSYQVGADELERYVDIMAALGAKTATSLEEIATSMQKVAATSNAVGVSMEQVSSIISTVSSVTRESAESIGTSFKTIFARMGDLKLGETLEDGIQLGQVSSQLAKIGVHILDVNGQMRDMGTVIEELMAKWGQLSSAEQVATAQIVAGKRQYTQLLALMENREMYQKNMQIAENSAGFTNKQADIYKESWAAASKEVRASMEGMWSQLIDDQAFIKATKGIATFVNEISKLIDRLGGFKGVLSGIGGALLSLYSPQIASKLDQITLKLKDFVTMGFGKSGNSPQAQFSKNLTQMKAELQKVADNPAFTESQKLGIGFDLEAIELKERLAKASGDLTKAQISNAEEVIGVLQTQKQIFVEAYEAYEKAAKDVESTANTMTNNAIRQELTANRNLYSTGGYEDRREQADINLAKNAMNAYASDKNNMASLGLSTTNVTDLQKTMNTMAAEGNLEKFSTTLESLGGKIDTAKLSQLQSIFIELGTHAHTSAKAVQEFQNAFIDNNIANSEQSLQQLKTTLTNFAQEANLTEEEMTQFNAAMEQITTKDELTAWVNKSGSGFELLKTKLKETEDSTNNLNTYLNILKTILGSVKGVDMNALEAAIKKVSGALANTNVNAEDMKRKLRGLFEESIKPASALASALTGLASAMMSIASVGNALKNTWKTLFEDPDATAWDKFAALMTGVGMAIMFVNTMQTASLGISKLIVAHKGAEATGWIASAAAAKVAGDAGFAASLKMLGVVGLIIAAILVVTTLVIKLINLFRKTTDETKSLREATDSLSNATDIASSKMSKILSVMSQMQAIVNDTTKSYKEQAEALSELAGQYGLTVDIIDVMNGNYATLEAQVKRIAEGQLLDTVTSLDVEIAAVDDEIAQLFTDNKIKVTLPETKDSQTTTLWAPNQINQAGVYDDRNGAVSLYNIAPHMITSDASGLVMGNTLGHVTDEGNIVYSGESTLFNAGLFTLTATPSVGLADSAWGLSALVPQSDKGTRDSFNYLYYEPENDTVGDVYRRHAQDTLFQQSFDSSDSNDLFYSLLTLVDTNDTLGSARWIGSKAAETLTYGSTPFLATRGNEEITLDVDSEAVGRAILFQSFLEDDPSWDSDLDFDNPEVNIDFESETFTIGGYDVDFADVPTALMNIINDYYVPALEANPDLQFGDWWTNTVAEQLIAPTTAGATDFGHTYAIAYTPMMQDFVTMNEAAGSPFVIENGQIYASDTPITKEGYALFDAFRQSYGWAFEEGGIFADLNVSNEDDLNTALAARALAEQKREEAEVVSAALTSTTSSLHFLTDPTEKTLGEILNAPLNITSDNQLEIGEVSEDTNPVTSKYTSIKDFDLKQIELLAGALGEFDSYSLASQQMVALVNRVRQAGTYAYQKAGNGLTAATSDKDAPQIAKEIEEYSNAIWDQITGDIGKEITLHNGQKVTVSADMLLQLDVADVEVVSMEDGTLSVLIEDSAYEMAHWAAEQLKIETRQAFRETNKEQLTKSSYTYNDYILMQRNKTLENAGITTSLDNFMLMSQAERELAVQEAGYADDAAALAVRQQRLEFIQGTDKQPGELATATEEFNAAVAEYEERTGKKYNDQAVTLATRKNQVAELEAIKRILQNDKLSAQEKQDALIEMGIDPSKYKIGDNEPIELISEDKDGNLQVNSGVISAVSQQIGTYSTEIDDITAEILDVKVKEDQLLALTAEQTALTEEINAGTFAANENNRVKLTNRVNAFSGAYGRRSEMTMDELETLMVYAGDKQSQDALMAAYTSDNEAEWNRLAYENAIKYYNELEKQYTNDPEKLAIVLEQKEALQNNYYANLQAQEQKTYNYKKELLQQDVEDQKEKVEILKELTKENAKLTDAQRKNLEQSGVDLTNYDRITDAQEKQIAGTKLYIAALGQQAMAEQAVIDKQKEGFDTMTSHGVTWKDYLLTNILGESDGELEAFVDLFNQDSSKELQKFINQSGMGQGLGSILLDIYNEAGGATLTQADILDALNAKLAELEDAGEDVWANFRTYAVEALTSVLSVEQSAAQETVAIWESAYKAIATAREGAMSGKTILESLYGDKDSLMAMIEVLTKNGYGTYSQVVGAMTSKDTSLNGLNGMIDRTAFGKSLGLGGSIFATNRDATQADWEAAAQQQAIDAAETIYAGMSDEVLLNAYGLVKKADGKYYRVQKDTNGKYVKDNAGAYVTDAEAVGATDLGMAYYNSIYGTADARAAAYTSQRNQYWAQDLIARQQATKYRQDKVSDWYGDMETLDKISRGERATDAAGIAQEVALLNSLGNNITAQDYITASPEQLATYAGRRTSMTPIEIADFNKSYGAASLYETDAQGNILKDDKGNPILKRIDGLAYDDKGVLLGRTVTTADGQSTTSMDNLSYEDRYAVHLQQQGLTSTDYTYEQYLRDYHGDKTFMTAAEKAAYEASKKHYDDKKAIDDTLKPHETAKTQLQELSELDLGSTDTEDNWNAIAAAVNEAGGSLKDWNEYSSVSARKTALLEANIAVAKDEATKAKQAYTDASAEGSTLTEEEIEQYRQRWMQAEADVAANQQELEQQKLAAATGALDAQIAKWQELETAINSASSTLSGFLSNIESWGSASFATIAKLEAEIATINKLAGTNIQYTGFTGNATTDRNNMLRMNLDVNKANAQLLTQEQNFIQGITTDMETAINKNNTDMMDALSRDTWYTDLAGMKDDKGNAVFTDQELAKMAKAREEALKFNPNLSGAELWKEVKRILGEEDAELGVKLKINEGERKDLWKQMLSDQIAQEEAAAAEIVSIWENAFQAILKAKEALASGKSIGEMLLGDKDQMTALISMLREAGYNMNQIYDILNSPEEIDGWTSKINEMTTKQRADKYGASHENLLYNEDGTLASNQGTYAAYRERVEADVRAEATDAYLISLLGAANYQRLTDENGKVIESDAEYQARIQAALTAKGDTVSTVTVKDGKITFTGDAGAALDNTVAEKMLAVTEQGWSDAIADMMYEEYKTIKDKEASELAQVNNRIAHENETRTYAVGDKQYTEAQIKAYNQAFTSALEEYEANGNLEGLDTESKKLLQEYFGLDSLAEVEDLSLSQLETGATTTADAMLAAAAAALAYADAQYTALGYTKDGNGQWSKTVNSEQYDAWYATNGKQYKDDAAARAAFDKEQWDTWYAANGSKYANEEAARAAYQPMPSQITIGLDETSQSTYDSLVDTVNTATDTTRTTMESINDRAINAVSEQASALGAINQAKAGSVEWYQGIDALREAYAGLEGAQDIITQLEQGTIDLNTANDRLADYTVNMIKNVGKLTDKQWDQYKALLRTNNITVDGYETIEDYIKAMEKARKKGQNFYKMLNKTGDGASELAEEMKAAAESTQDLNDDVNVASKALDFFDFGDYAKDSTDDIAKLKQGFQDLFSSPETLNAVNGFVDFINSKNVDWSTLFDASGAGASAEAMLSYLTNTVGMTQAQVDALCAAAGGDWTTVYNLLMNLFGSVNPESYNEAAAALQAFFASAGVNITVPKFGGGGGGGGGNYTPPPSGGGGGGGGEPKKLDKKRGRDEIERYHYLEKQLERVAEKLEEIDKIKERTFGKKHLDAIDDEIAALEKETKIQEEYLKEAETRYKNLDTKRMERLGGKFDEDGNLKNYEDVMKGLIDEYNAFITKYNNASADEQKNMEEEKTKKDKWFEDQKQFLENYEDTIKIINEKKNELEELKNKKSAAELEKITYKIEVITEFNDKDIEILEYYQSLYEDNLDLQGDFVRNLTQTSQEYVQNFSAISQAKADLDQKYKDGKITQADYIEGLQQLQESSLEYASSIEEVKKQMEEAYGNTLELAQDEMDKHNDALEHSSNLISSYISIMQLLGKGPNYAKLREFYQYQHAANLENIKTQRLWLETWEKEALYYEQKGTLTELEQKQYEELQEKIRESREELVSSTEEALSALQEAYENSINAIFKTLDENLGGAYDSLTQVAELYGYYQEKQANYVSTAKELHEISKLNRDIENSLEDVLTTTSKERLKALQQEINLISERNKLSEYDIEMMNLQYQLALAQIALEEAQASKDTVRLTRDEDGNMAYQYTADASKVSEAQQQYEDILQQINDLSANRVSELEQQFLEIQQNYRDTAQEILLDTNLTEEEKVAKLAALAEHSKNQMNYIQEQYGNASKHLMENQAAIAQQYGQSLIDTTDATSRQMNEMLANMIQNTQAQVELFDKAISGKGLEAFRQYLADIGVVLNTSGTSENGLPGAAQDASDAAKEAAESADETAKKINSATAAVHAATEEWLKHAGALDSVRDSYVAIAEAIQKIVAAESGFSSDEGMAGIWEGTEDLAERQAQIIKQQQELMKNAQETLDTQIETEIINGKHLEDIGAAYEEHLNKIANTQVDSNENITSTLLNQSEYLAIQESFVSQLSELLSGSNLQNMYGNATASILGFNGTNNGLIQQIELHADFSAAESAAEIKEALELFVQTASQYAYSTDRAPTTT